MWKLVVLVILTLFVVLVASIEIYFRMKEKKLKRIFAEGSVVKFYQCINRDFNDYVYYTECRIVEIKGVSAKVIWGNCSTTEYENIYELAEYQERRDVFHEDNKVASF